MVERCVMIDPGGKCNIKFGFGKVGGPEPNRPVIACYNEFNEFLFQFYLGEDEVRSLVDFAGKLTV